MSRLIGPLVALVTTLVCLALAEVALRAVAPVPDPYEFIKAPPEPPNRYIRSFFPPDMDLRTEPEPGLPGVTGPNRFTTNAMGFRGPELARPKPASEYRIFMVGGSSTECFYLDDADALHTVVQNALAGRIPGREVRVYNAGKSGDRSDDHVSMIVHRIVHLEADAIVVFAGINDLRASVFGYDYLHYQPERQVEAPNRLGFTDFVKLSVLELQLGRRFYYLAKRMQPPTRSEVLTAIPLRSSVRAAVEERKAAQPVATAPQADVAAYERNLRTIAGAAQAQGTRLVFMTQQTTWASTADPGAGEWQWMLLGPDGRYDGAAMAAEMEELNDAMRRVAAELGVPLYDTVRDVAPTLEHFYDDVHFNVGGARRAGEGVAAVLAQVAAASAPAAPARTPAGSAPR